MNLQPFIHPLINLLLYTSHHITSHHITSHHITSHHITSHHITSHHITSHHITSHHITSHHITSHDVTSHHTTPHHITSHHITCTSHHITSSRNVTVPINYLLMNLAVADIMFAAFIAPMRILELTSTHTDGLTGTVLCKLLTCGNMAWVGSASSILTLVNIAIERYYVVLYPYRNKSYLNRRRLKVIIPSSWIFSLILNFPAFFLTNVEKSNNCSKEIWEKKWMGRANGLMWLVLAVLPTALTVGLYSRVVYTLWCKRNDDNQLTHQQMGVVKVRKRVTLMVVSVSAIFGICWITVTVGYMLSQFNFNIYGDSTNVISLTLVMFNSAVNPLLYGLFNHKFRKKFSGMLCCCTRARLPTFRVHASGNPQGIEVFKITITQPTQKDLAL
ncbi:hypothetical protein ACROYT_G038934 [Oculina patagonica]